MNNFEPRYIRLLLIFISFFIVCVLIFSPLFVIFKEAFSSGFSGFLAVLNEENAKSAIKVSLLCVLVVVPINTIFGILLAYGVAKFDFAFKNLINTALEVPFAVCPVIVGLCFVLLLGDGGFLDKFGVLSILKDRGIYLLYALPAIFLVCAFISFPFVAKELILFFSSQGNAQEEAALSLGASSFVAFWKITLPQSKWALFYGVCLASARCLGEFGAVAVVSGAIVGKSANVPVYIEILYSEYAYGAGFALSLLLSLFVLLGLIFKIFLLRTQSTKENTNFAFMGAK